MQPFKRTFGNGQRVRVGLTGLAAIFLIVVAAAAGLRPEASPAAAASNGDAHGETLAVLGVAPGSGNEAEGRRQSRLDADRPRRAQTRI